MCPAVVAINQAHIALRNETYHIQNRPSTRLTSEVAGARKVLRCSTKRSRLVILPPQAEIGVYKTASNRARSAENEGNAHLTTTQESAWPSAKRLGYRWLFIVNGWGERLQNILIMGDTRGAHLGCLTGAFPFVSIPSPRSVGYGEQTENIHQPGRVVTGRHRVVTLRSQASGGRITKNRSGSHGDRVGITTGITTDNNINPRRPNPSQIIHFASNPSPRRGPIFDRPEEASSRENVIGDHGVWNEPSTIPSLTARGAVNGDGEKRYLLEARRHRCRSDLSMPWARLGSFQIFISTSLVRGARASKSERSLRSRTRHPPTRGLLLKASSTSSRYCPPPFSFPHSLEGLVVIKICTVVFGMRFLHMNLTVRSFPAPEHLRLE